MSERFESVVLDGHKGLAFEIPFDPAAQWSVAPVPLRRAGAGSPCGGPSIGFDSRAWPSRGPGGPSSS